MRMPWVVFVLVALGCGSSAPDARQSGQDPVRSAAAVTALRGARFADAVTEADKALAAAPRDSTAAAVRALARYQRAGEAFITEGLAVLDQGDVLNFFDHDKGRKTWLALLTALDAVDADLAIAAADSQFALELCIACWRYDWNRNGEWDPRDALLFMIQFDEKGEPLPDGDPRAVPTYRFDVGDIYWARAMVSFQRGVAELVLAYRWSELDKLLRGSRGGAADPTMTIKLVDAGRVRAAHARFVAGLGFSNQERLAYLAETDDDREWVPNPRQKSFAMPLTVDAALYETWAAVLTDVQGLLASEAGVGIREAVAALASPQDALGVPDAYVDLGRMLREPKDIVVTLERGSGSDADLAERLLRGALGNGYRETMRASPLVGRLRHMKEQLERGEDELGHKLRYLLWVN